MATLSVGPLLPVPGNKPATAAVAVDDDTDGQVESACSDDATVVVEGVGFAVVIVIAFAAFAIGVLLMSSLWFIYVKTSKSRHSSLLRLALINIAFVFRRSYSVLGVESCTIVFLGGHFLFTFSDFLAVGCII